MEMRERGVARRDEGMETRERGMVERDEGRTWRRAVVGAAVAAVVMVAALPDALHACPVCFDRDDEARIAFLATTGLLTLLPLGLVAGTGAWLRRRMREVRGEEGGEGD